MATVNIYDKISGLTKTITIDVSTATISNSGQGRESFYLTVSTSAKDPSGKTIPTQILTDANFNDPAFAGDISACIQASIVNIFAYITGEYDFSSSSESSQSSNNSLSSQSGDSKSSQSSKSSSSSTQHKANSSSSSSSKSSSSKSSVSSVSSLSSESSPSSRG